jgi:hypothetical protein
MAMSMSEGVDGGALLLRAKFWWGVEQNIISAKLWHDFCTKQRSRVDLGLSNCVISANLKIILENRT